MKMVASSKMNNFIREHNNNTGNKRALVPIRKVMVPKDHCFNTPLCMKRVDRRKKESEEDERSQIGVKHSAHHRIKVSMRL